MILHELLTAVPPENSVHLDSEAPIRIPVDSRPAVSIGRGFGCVAAADAPTCRLIAFPDLPAEFLQICRVVRGDIHGHPFHKMPHHRRPSRRAHPEHAPDSAREPLGTRITFRAPRGRCGGLTVRGCGHFVLWGAVVGSTSCGRTSLLHSTYPSWLRCRPTDLNSSLRGVPSGPIIGLEIIRLSVVTL